MFTLILVGSICSLMNNLAPKRGGFAAAGLGGDDSKITTKPKPKQIPKGGLGSFLKSMIRPRDETSSSAKLPTDVHGEAENAARREAAAGFKGVEDARLRREEKINRWHVHYLHI
mmetsp:Transcript_34256/g.47652  ORF Transcript_34256/g.47652 Transcript_34256/m.47652 type:complete len:115 (-) Transcript_34256:465-809(-)